MQIDNKKEEFRRSFNQSLYEEIRPGEYADNRIIRPTTSNAYINNITFLKTLDEVETLIDSHDGYDIEILLGAESVDWTAPRWGMAGDICLFMHAKNAKTDISRLRTELRNSSHYDDSEKEEIFDWLDRGKELYNQYGGKIFAVAQIVGQPYDDSEATYEGAHWKMRIYAEMGNIWILDNPIDISEFRDFIIISSRGAITPLYGGDYDKLKELIISKNPNPPTYFRNSAVNLVPMTKIDEDNWLSISSQYRGSFIYEIQFRRYYVDYFLKVLGDRKTIYSECRVVKPGVTTKARMDNVILFCGRYLPVEVKLSVLLEEHLEDQVSQYCNDSAVFLDKDEKRSVSADRFYNNHVLIIDRQNLYLYDDRNRMIVEIYNLDAIHQPADILKFRELLSKTLLPEYGPLPQSVRKRERQQRGRK